MKVRIKSFNGELLDLTPNKEYVVENIIDNDLVLIVDDVGCEIAIRIPCSAFLQLGSWEIVK